MTEDEYRRQIVAFAERARDFFDGIEKDPDDTDAELLSAFWQEYDGLLARHSRAA